MQQASDSSRPQLPVLPLPLSCCQSSSLLPKSHRVGAHCSQTWSAGVALRKQLRLMATQNPSLPFPQAKSRWHSPLWRLLLLFPTAAKLLERAVQLWTAGT